MSSVSPNQHCLTTYHITVSKGKKPYALVINYSSPLTRYSISTDSWYLHLCIPSTVTKPIRPSRHNTSTLCLSHYTPLSVCPTQYTHHSPHYHLIIVPHLLQTKSRCLNSSPCSLALFLEHYIRHTKATTNIALKISGHNQKSFLICALTTDVTMSTLLSVSQ